VPTQKGRDLRLEDAAGGERAEIERPGVKLEKRRKRSLKGVDQV